MLFLFFLSFRHIVGSGNEIVITYGDLIDLYNIASTRAEQCGSLCVKDLFIELFYESFPSYHLTSRPERFIETVERIVAPTKSSLRGPPKLSDSSLLSYRHRIWKPRVGNPRAGQYGMRYAVTSDIILNSL